MAFIFVRLTIFLDAAGVSVLKTKFAIWKRQRQQNMIQNATDVSLTSRDTGQKEEEAGRDSDVLAEAAKISAGNVDENVPILLQNLTKTFVDASSGLEIKAVQGVSFEVPVSQVVVLRHGASHVASHVASRISSPAFPCLE
jgi:hypothetical protein